MGRDLERATEFIDAHRPRGQRRYSSAEVRTMIHAHLHRFAPMTMTEHLG